MGCFTVNQELAFSLISPGNYNLNNKLPFRKLIALMLCSLCFKQKPNCTFLFIQAFIYPAITTYASHAYQNAHAIKASSTISAKLAWPIIKLTSPNKPWLAEVVWDNIPEPPLKMLRVSLRPSAYSAGLVIRPSLLKTTSRVFLFFYFRSPSWTLSLDLWISNSLD